MAIKVSTTTVIDNSKNITNVGNVGDSDTVYYGDGSNLSGVGGSGNEFVASGTIPNGATVVINTDGTVGIVTQTESGSTVGTAVVFENGRTEDISPTYDSTNGKVVIVYTDSGNSYTGTAIVGTVSGTSISFGTAVVFNSADTFYSSVTYDSTNGKVVISYQDDGNSSYGTAIVGTVSGTSISFGSPVVFNSATTYSMSAIYDSTNQKVVISYQDDGNSSKGTSIVGTVSGTSISFGSAVVFNNSITESISSTYDSTNQKVIISYRKFGFPYIATAIVGTVSDTSISFGTGVVFESGNTNENICVYDSANDKVVIAYRDVGNSSYGTAIVGTVSGTSISFGTAVVFNNGQTESISPTYDSTNQKVVISYQDLGNSGRGTSIVGTVSGTSISFGTGVVFESGNTIFCTSIYDSTNNKVVIAYQDDGSSDRGTSVVFSTVTQTTNLTDENYIGLAAQSISNGATGKITTRGGFNTGQTGLTTGRTYYIQGDGSLTLTPDDPSVVAGKSISDTKIIVS